MLEYILSLLVLIVALILYLTCIPPPSCVKDKFEWYVNSAPFKAAYYLGRIGFHLRLWRPYAPLQFLSFSDRNLPANDKVTCKFEDISGIRTLVIAPKVKNERGATLIYLHGGGFVVGTPEAYAGFLCRLVEELGCTVYAPEYRKAPQHIFPNGFKDCYNVALEVITKSDEWGLDPSRIIIGGDSAGGHLATTVTRELCVSGDVVNPSHLPKLQVLVYPITQVVNYKTPSYAKGFDGIIWNDVCIDAVSLYLNGDTTSSSAMSKNAHASDVVAEKWKKLIGEPFMRDGPVSAQAEKLENLLLDPRVSPLMIDDLSGSIPALIQTAKYDPLHWEGVKYAQRLKKAGVEVLHKDYDSFHGSLPMKDGELLQTDIIKYVREFLE